MKKNNWLRAAAFFAALALMVTAGCGKKEEQPAEEDSIVLEVPAETPGAQETVPPIEIIGDEGNATPRPDGIPDEGDEHPGEKMSYDADYQRMKDTNSDVMGWISVPNTRVEYPVLLENGGTNNEFYLTHNIEKSYSKSGSIFMDYRNARENEQKHIILYGHNMRNGTMFHDLNSYKEKSFFENTNTITMYWGEEKVEYEVYNVAILTADIYFIKTKFDNDEEFAAYMNELKTYSKFNNLSGDITIAPEDQILTLVTCTYEYDNSRLVIQARRK